MISLKTFNNLTNRIMSRNIERTLRPISNEYDKVFNNLLKINYEVTFNGLRNCRHFKSKLGH